MTSSGKKRATPERVFDRPDTRSRWWKDKAARHTCRWHGKECKWSCWFREHFASDTPPPLSL